MKKGLLGSTALIGATALMGGAAGAAEAPEYKLSGNMNFQFYWIDQDWNWMESKAGWLDGNTLAPTSYISNADIIQDHGWYFGVDEAELALNVSGAADNGLKYGFKVEIQVNTTDGTVADEARIQLSGSWGTLQLGDEDGAEDTMNYGGENLMGATGGFDGDFDDVLVRVVQTAAAGTSALGGDDALFAKGMVWGAPSYPGIAGDTSDKTKITYYSPRFSGFQVGASLTPTPSDGDNFKADGREENHIGIGANYDNTFGSLRIRASAVYSGASAVNNPGSWQYQDVSAWQVGGIIGFGPFSVAGNYVNNGDSGQPLVWDVGSSQFEDTGIETYSWNAAASFETGPMSFAAGYFASNIDWGTYFTGNGLNGDLSWLDSGTGEGDFTVISLTADYTMAPGLGVYAEVDFIDDETGIETGYFNEGPSNNSATLFILGVNASF